MRHKRIMEEGLDYYRTSTRAGIDLSEVKNSFIEGSILKQISELTLVINAANYEILWANPVFCKLYDTNPADVKNKTCHKVIKGIDHPCMACDQDCPIQSTSRRSDKSEISRKDYSCFHIKDRAISPTKVIPVGDNNGQLEPLVLFAKDLTGILSREEKIYREKEFLERILETTSSFIVTLDRTGRITYFNSAARGISGYDLDEVIGREWETLFGRLNNERDQEGIFLLTKDGRKRVMSWSNTFIKDAEKNVVGVICIGQDITERERTKRDLEILHQFTQKVISRPTLSNITTHLFQVIEDISPGSEPGLLFLNSKRDGFLPPIHPEGLHRVSDVLSKLIHSSRQGGIIDWLEKISRTGIVSRRNLAIGDADFLNALNPYDDWFLFPLVKDLVSVGLLIIGFPKKIEDGLPDLRVISTLVAYLAGPLSQAVEVDEQIQLLKAQIRGRTSFMKLVGKSREMQKVYDLIPDVAQSNATILLTGESGTGKEVVARAIHEASPRGGGPFVVANCAAYPANLLESELFGHERGAFTGAIRRKQGRFEQAHRGTLFLDEIGEVSPATQILLLRVLQDRRFERIGGETTIETDTRIIAATNKDLGLAVREGKFREDLFYRVNVINIHLPPLRKRIDDVPLLCQYFLEKYNLLEDKNVRNISRSAMELLCNYHWPGNVRELENVISRAVVLAKSSTIEADQLSLSWNRDELASDNSLNETEKQLVLKTLLETNWNKQRAARQLKISRSTLYSKINKYHLAPSKSI
ncbi:MAG: sigma 54-interacting transcriptional regulator [Pseudomonadota bacterium]